MNSGKMSKRIYLEMIECPSSWESLTPYSIDIIARHEGKSYFIGSWSGEIDYEKVGTSVAQGISKLGLSDLELVLPEMENETLDGIEETLRLHSANKIFRGSRL